MLTLFNDQQAITRMKVVAEKIRTITTNDDFSNTRNQFIFGFLTSMASDPEEWDDMCQINIELVGSRLHDCLEKITSDTSNASLDGLFAICFRFVLEFDLNTPPKGYDFFEGLMEFVSQNLKMFDEQAARSLRWALTQMPITMTKRLLNHEDVAVLRKAENTRVAVEDRIKDWEDDLKDKIDAWNKVLQGNTTKAEGLLRSLVKFQTGANFVGLHQGFKRIRDEKQKELENAKGGMTLLAVGSTLPLLGKIYWLTRAPIAASTLEAFMRFLPFLSITAITLYFFRVVLMDYKSIKSQLLQIDLRMSLCEFIQSYADYAAEIKDKDKEALEQFEKVIFSGIVADESKIPAAFDGLEQLVKIISSARKPD